MKQKARESVTGFWKDVQNNKRKSLEDYVIEEEKASGHGVPGLKRKIVIKQVCISYIIYPVFIIISIIIVNNIQINIIIINLNTLIYIQIFIIINLYIYLYIVLFYLI